MLSRAEQSVANYIINGMANKAIADVLCVSEKTVKFHLTNIYKKEGVKSRHEFAAKSRGDLVRKEEVIEELRPNVYAKPEVVEDVILPLGAKPTDPDRIVTIQEARRMEQESRTPQPMQQGARQVQVIGKTQEQKINFIDEKFKVGETITQLHTMMKDVVSKELTPNTVNAACNCVARLNETINTAIQAAKFLNER